MDFMSKKNSHYVNKIMRAEISSLRKTTFKTTGVTNEKNSHELFLFSICKWELLKIVAIANKIEEMIK